MRRLHCKISLNHSLFYTMRISSCGDNFKTSAAAVGEKNTEVIKISSS